MSVFRLHSPPVYLSAMPLQYELKAGNLQDAEEAVTHHTGNGVIYTKKTLSKPGKRQERDRPRSSNSLVKINKHVSLADILDCCLILSTPKQPKQLVALDNCCTLGAGRWILKMCVSYLCMNILHMHLSPLDNIVELECLANIKIGATCSLLTSKVYLEGWLQWCIYYSLMSSITIRPQVL